MGFFYKNQLNYLISLCKTFEVFHSFGDGFTKQADNYSACIFSSNGNIKENLQIKNNI